MLLVFVSYITFLSTLYPLNLLTRFPRWSIFTPAEEAIRDYHGAGHPIFLNYFEIRAFFTNLPPLRNHQPLFTQCHSIPTILAFLQNHPFHIPRPLQSFSLPRLTFTSLSHPTSLLPDDTLLSSCTLFTTQILQRDFFSNTFRLIQSDTAPSLHLSSFSFLALSLFLFEFLFPFPFLLSLFYFLTLFLLGFFPFFLLSLHAFQSFFFFVFTFWFFSLALFVVRKNLIVFFLPLS